MAVALLASVASCAFLQTVFAQPAYVYDGVSTVNLTGQYNWTLKYPLGGICEDVNWGKKLTINMLAMTNQADIICAFGTEFEYFAFVVAYDRAVHVPINNPDYNPLAEPRRIGAVFVTPPSNSPLQQALVTLEQQYARSINFRSSLITTMNQTKEWEMIADDDEFTNPIAKNGSPMVLHIQADRRTGRTYLLIEKNGRNASIEMGSTWGYGDDVYLFMGMDGIHDEIFTLYSIISEDDCSWTARPTTARPTAPTLEPSEGPTVSPTSTTLSPSDSPSGTPTDSPTATINTDQCDWTCYVSNYADLSGMSASEAQQHYIQYGYDEGRNCQCNPTMDPSESPTLRPTALPSVPPTKAPTVGLSEVPTASPLVSTTSAPTKDPTDIDGNVGGDDEDENGGDEDADSNANQDEGFANSEELIKGVNNVHLFIGIGGLLLLILIVVGVACFFKFKNRTLRTSVAYMADDW